MHIYPGSICIMHNYNKGKRFDIAWDIEKKHAGEHTKYYEAYLLLNKRSAKPENVLDNCIET